MNALERDLDILGHIIRYCDQIDEAVRRFGDDAQVFAGDVVYQNAVAMCLLQIGELVGHLSEEYREGHPAMPWRQIKALRNIIAHNYGKVDAETAWEIARDDIPALRAYCAGELKGREA